MQENSAAISVVLDAIFSPPRTIVRRDLRHLGRGYSLDVLLGGRLSSTEEEDSEVGALDAAGLDG